MCVLVTLGMGEAISDEPSRGGGLEGRAVYLSVPLTYILHAPVLRGLDGGWLEPVGMNGFCACSTDMAG